MSASEWYKRQKGKLKRALRTESRGSISLSNQSNASSPGPSPQVTLNPAIERPELSTGIPTTTSPTAVEPSSHQPTQPAASSTASTQNPSDHAQPLTAVTTAAATTKSLPDDTPKVEKSQKKVAWSGLKALLDVLKSGAGAFGPLRSAIEGLENCIGTFERASKARDDYQELGEKLDQLLGDLAEFNFDGLGKAMTTSVKNLCSGIEAELKIVEGKQGRNAPGRHIEAKDDSDTILECYRRIHGHVERLMLNANLNMWRIIDEEITDRRLRQLSPTMSGAYNSWASDRTKRRRCIEGTRVRELNKLKEWASDPSAEAIYWINGMAGTGKTTIAYTLCADLNATNELAASFFCTRMIPECRNIQLIIPSLAYQLAQFSYPFRHALSKTLEADQMAHTREIELQFQALIADPLKAVQHTLPSSLVVVIDALNECEDDDRIGKILDILIASTSSLPIRLLVSSRPEAEIYRRMMEQMGSNPEAKLVLHEPDTDDPRHDIEAYLRHELRDVHLTAKQWDGLLERCGVLFIYASTVYRYIKFSNEMMCHEEAIDTVLGISLEGTRDMEKNLDKLYLTILEAVFKNPHISEQNGKQMKTLLDTIICAASTMTIVGLTDLLGLKNAEHVQGLLRPLSSVVDVLEPSGFALPLHASFSDFMLSPDRSASFHCVAEEHHTRLAQACLKQISLNPVQFNLCGIESSYLLDEEVPGLSERIPHAISHALYYASCYWTTHLDFSGYPVELREPVQDFLSARLLLWMEVLNLNGLFIFKGELRVSMKKVERWCREAGMSQDVIELAHDAGDFVSSYAESPVRKSTPHIYTSMLPFWPSTSPISRTYIPRMTRMLQPKGTGLDTLYHPLIAQRYLGEAMRSAVYSPEGTRIVAAVGCNILILDGGTGETILGPLKGHADLVTSVAVSPNGLYIASGSDDATIRIWDTKNGKIVTGPFRAHDHGVRSVAFSPNSALIVSTSGYGTFRVWSVQDGEHIFSANSGGSGTEQARTAAFSFDGSRIISGDYNGAVCFWDAQTGDLLSELHEGHSGPINSVALSYDGSQIISTSEDSTVCVWDTATQQVLPHSHREHFGGIKQASLSPNKMYIASCDDSTVHLSGTRREENCILPNKHRGYVNSVAFSPDGARFVSCSEDGIICIWSVRYTLDEINWFSVIRSACFSSDGSQIITGGADGHIYQWDASSGELVAGPLLGHKGYICSVAISSDKAYIASASSDKTIRLWDLNSGENACRILETHTKRPDALRFSQDDSHLFYGSQAYSVDTSSSTPELASPLKNESKDQWATEVPRNHLEEYHRGRPLDRLSCITHSPDGSYAASGSTYGAIRLWHTRNGQLIMNLRSGCNSAISVILFSLDGTRLATCSRGHDIRIWTIPGKSIDKVMNSNISDTHEETGVTVGPNSHWKFCEDGWITNERKELLAWIPYEYRSCLQLPENDVLISHWGSVKIDFTGRNIGRLWTESYHPA